MAQTLKTPSPFDFVPFLDKPVKRQPLERYRHERFNPDLLSGELTFQLENLTYLLIASGRDEQGFPKERNAKKTFVSTQTGGSSASEKVPVIPCTSLKGMVRSLYELVSHSCLWMINDYYKDTNIKPTDHEPLRSNRNKIKACSRIESLCPACALFGFMSRMESWKGRVNIGDGHFLGFREGNRLVSTPKYLKNQALPVQGQPRPKARPNSERHMDYLPNNQLAGRKLNFHTEQVHITNAPRDRGRTGQRPIEAEGLHPKHVFEFNVKYTNLTKMELATLLECITLRPGWAHHLGTGKSYGWGSCRVTLTAWQELDMTQRYRQLKGGLVSLNTDEISTKREALAKKVDKQVFDVLQPFLDWDGKTNLRYGFEWK